MKLDEAESIRRLREAPEHLQREASRVIQLANAMARVQGSRIEFEGLSRQDRERINAILAYRLAVACGKLRDWAPEVAA